MANFSTYLLYLWTFIILGRPQDVFPQLKPFHPLDITAGLTILSYFLSQQRHSQRILSFPEVRLFLIFCGLMAISIPFGYYPRRGILFLYAFLIKLGLYLYFIEKLVTDEKCLTGFVNALFLSGLIMAIAAILEVGVSARVGGGSTYDANDLGLHLVVTLPIAITQGLTTASRLWKIIFFGTSPFFIVGIIATQSRGAFLGLVIVGLAALNLKELGLPRKKLIIPLVVLAMVFAAYAGQHYKERMSTILEDVSRITAGSGRVLIWKRALVMAKDNPFLGVGPDAFETAYGSYLSSERFTGDLSPDSETEAWAARGWATAHNSYLLVLVELGIPGLLIFIAFIMRCFRNLRNIRALSPQQIEPTPKFLKQAAGLKLALVGYLTCAFFLSQPYYPYLYIILFMSAAMLRIFQTENTSDK